MSDFIKKVQQSITDSINQGVIGDNQGVLSGFSGEYMIGTLQRLAQNVLDENSCYLEVGVYQGLTLLSVAKAAPQTSAFGIDNFAFFDKDGKNFSMVKERMQQLNVTNAGIINMDYEDALEQLEQHLGGKKVGVYFIDGPHDYRSQLMCLALIKPFLAENAVIIVDDCNYRHVRQANRDFLYTNKEYKLIFESYSDAHPLNSGDTDRYALRKSWWDGVNIIVTDHTNELKEMYPPTFRSRALYENEHAIHASKHPEVIPFLFKLTDMMAPIVYKFSKLKNRKDVIKGKFKSMNTYSEGLPTNHFNDSIN